MPATFKKLVDDVENRLRHATSDANKAEDALATALTTAGAPQYCRTTAAAFADAEQRIRTTESEVTAALSRLYASLASLRDREALREADREKARERARHRRRSKQRYRSHTGPRDNTGTRSSGRSPPPPPPKPKAKTRQHPQAPKPRVISPESIQQWHEACTLAFKDKPLLRAFPQPPSEPCGDARCRAERRVLEACYCNIRKAFKGRAADLKSDRVKFHPDRFMRVPGDVRERVRRAAGEVFVVVNGMFQKVDEEGKNGL